MNLKSGRDHFFAKITSEVPLEVKYFEPTVKGGYLSLNDTIFEVFLEDLDDQVHPPETIRKGRRVFYSFD